MSRQLRSYVNEHIVEKVRSAGGEIYAVLSEPRNLRIRPTNTGSSIFKYWRSSPGNFRICSERGLTLYANQGDLEFLQRGANWDIEHPKGFFQPGVLR